MFVPSRQSYGDSSPAAEEETDYRQMLEEYGPALMGVLKGKSPREKVEVLRAKLENQYAAYNATTGFARKLLAANIIKLMAQLRAAEAELAEAEETSLTLRYGKGMMVVGGFLTLTLGSLLAVKAIQYLNAAKQAQDRS